MRVHSNRTPSDLIADLCPAWDENGILHLQEKQYKEGEVVKFTDGMLTCIQLLLGVPKEERRLLNGILITCAVGVEECLGGVAAAAKHFQTQDTGYASPNNPLIARKCMQLQCFSMSQ